MIVPMMKLSLLIFYKEYQTFLGELREKGMVHIHENTERTAEDTDLQAKLMLIRRTGEMITHMQSRNGAGGKSEGGRRAFAGLSGRFV